MIDGTWVLTAIDPPPLAELDATYLPSGTAVRLRVLGPTRAALEQARGDELGGEFRLSPPFPPGIASSPIGLLLALDREPARSAILDCTFVIYRWSAGKDGEPENQFFAENGATVGSVFVTIFVPALRTHWELWFRNPQQMLGYTLAEDGAEEPGFLVQLWQRVPN